MTQPEYQRFDAPGDERVQLQVLDAQKSYGHVEALRGVSLDAVAGDVIGLVGDNGAGKSTFVKALSGLVHLDSGQIRIDGEAMEITSPRVARELGIEVVHQHLALVESLDVTANLYLNREQRHRNSFLARLGWLDERGMKDEASRILSRLGIRLSSVSNRVELLSGGQRQAVAVGRAAGWGRRIVIMDEPTAALGVDQKRLVLDLVRRLQTQGLLVILVSHNMQEILDVCTRAVVLRHGSVVADVRTGEVSARDLVDFITGAV